MHVDKRYLCVCLRVCVYIHVVLPVNRSFAEERSLSSRISNSQQQQQQ